MERSIHIILWRGGLNRDYGERSQIENRKIEAGNERIKIKIEITTDNNDSKV